MRVRCCILLCVWEKQAKYCRNEDTIAFNTFQILNRERKQERFKYFIFQGVLRALGKYELCSVCCVLTGWECAIVCEMLGFEHGCYTLARPVKQHSSLWAYWGACTRFQNMSLQTSCTLLRRHVHPPPFQSHSCIALKVETFKNWELLYHLWICLVTRFRIKITTNGSLLLRVRQVTGMRWPSVRFCYMIIKHFAFNTVVTFRHRPCNNSTLLYWFSDFEPEQITSIAWAQKHRISWTLRLLE